MAINNAARIAACTFLLIASAANAQVYRCTDKAGKVYYGDAACPTGATSAQVAPAATNSEVELQRERAQLARERFLLDQEKRNGRASPAAPQNAGDATPQRPRIDSYECEVAKKNLGVGISKESKQRSEQQYESACFGDKAADIQKARAGNPGPTKIIINTNR